MIGSKYNVVSAVAGHLKQPVYYVENQQQGTFVAWNRRRSPVTPADLVRTARELARTNRKDLLLITSYDLGSEGRELADSARFNAASSVMNATGCISSPIARRACCTRLDHWTSRLPWQDDKLRWEVERWRKPGTSIQSITTWREKLKSNSIGSVAGKMAPISQRRSFPTKRRQKKPTRAQKGAGDHTAANVGNYRPLHS